MEVDEQNAVPKLGIVDATIVVLAEQLGVRRIATRDTRNFGAIRLRDGTRFQLVVHPTRPDVS